MGEEIIRIKTIPVVVLVFLSVALAGGQFLVDTSVAYIPAPQAQTSPALARGSQGSLAVWEDLRDEIDIYAGRIDADGTIRDTGGFVVCNVLGAQRSPAVAFDGSNWLVVWHDYRNGPEADIYAARVSESGVLLDSAGIAITLATGNQRFPAVTFDGSNFVVVWQDYRNRDTSDIYAARVSPDGSVLDPNGIAVSLAQNFQWFPKVAFDGVNCLIVWQDRRSGYYGIYGARLSHEGAVRDPGGLLIARADTSRHHPAVAFDGQNYLVAWEDITSGDSGSIFGVRVNSSGQVLDPSEIALCTAPGKQDFPVLAFDGANFIAAWQDRRLGDSADIYACRVDRNGNVLEPEGIPVSTAVNSQTGPAVAYDGGNWLGVWQDSRAGDVPRLYRARITPDGQVLDPDGALLLVKAENQAASSAASNGSDYFVAWQAERNGSDVCGVRVGRTGVMLDSVVIPVSVAAGKQESPEVATNGRDYLVVWEDARNGDFDIYGARVSQDGQVLDPDGIAICQGPGDQKAPQVASDSSGFLVVWHDGRNGSNLEILGCRVSGDGAVLDSQGIIVSSGSADRREPAVACNGQEYFVAWQDWRSARFYGIYGARVDAAGVLRDSSGIAIADGDYYQERPAVAGSSAGFIVAWEDERSGYSAVRAARVTAEGVLLDSLGIQIEPSPGAQVSVAASSSDLGYMLVWEDTGDIAGAKVAFDGTVMECVSVVSAPGNQHAPCLAVNGFREAIVGYTDWTATVAGRTCRADRVWATLMPLVGVGDGRVPPVGQSFLTAYPNPCSGILHMRIAESGPGTGLTRVTLWDAVGRERTSWDLKSGVGSELDLRNLAPGVYFVGTGNPEARTRVVLTR